MTAMGSVGQGRLLEQAGRDPGCSGVCMAQSWGDEGQTGRPEGPAGWEEGLEERKEALGDPQPAKQTPQGTQGVPQPRGCPLPRHSCRQPLSRSQGPDRVVNGAVPTASTAGHVPRPPLQAPRRTAGPPQPREEGLCWSSQEDGKAEHGGGG